MKNVILDDIFNDDLRSQLKLSEKVIWEGKPSFNLFPSFFKRNNSIISKLFEAILIFPFIIIGWLTLGTLSFLFILFHWIFQLIIVFLFILLMMPRITSLIKRKKTKYLITDQRIIFQLWNFEPVLMDFWKRIRLKYYDLPFASIKKIVIVRGTNDIGTIYLTLKNSDSINFTTYNLINGDIQHCPTIEIIEDIDKVSQFIKLGIQKKL